MSSAEPVAQNEVQQDNQNSDQYQQQIRLQFTLQGRPFMPLEVAPSDSLLEIKQYLRDSTILYFFTNYHFRFEGKALNEYVDIASLNLPENHTLDIKIDPFDEKSAKLHVKKVQEALSNRSILPSIFESSRLAAEQSQETENSAKKRGYKDSSDEEEVEEKVEVPKEKNSKKDKNTTESTKPVAASSEQNGKAKANVITLNDAITPSLANKILENELKSKGEEALECLTFINFSGFNPPPHYRRIVGDLFYLNVKTLENMSYHVTASPQGFFVNKCSSKTFDPEQAQQNLKFLSLIDLLKHISQQFREQFEKMINSNVKADKMNFPVLSFFKYGTSWLAPHESNSEHEWNMNRCEEFLVNLHGFDVNGPRDWNEELQISRDLSKTDFISRLTRDKAQIKIQSDFVEAATEGAKAVVEKNIQPLNPMDPVHQQVYVYNQIFFSFALENTDHFKQETGPDASPNVSTANSDLRNLKVLHSLDIAGLSVLNTCLVDYKGYRVIAQSIIPGILNSDHSNCSQYGSIDDGKTICSNPEFEEIMRKICEHFHLDDDVKFYDESKKEHSLCGSIEVKGIRGSDKRNYILDLMRLSPRDLNYQDSTEHQCCTLRHELINNFALTKKFEDADKKIKEEEEKEEQKKSEDETQEEKNKRGLARFLKIKEYMSNPDSQIKLKLNPNICTKAPLVELPKLKEQHLQLMDISQFLLNKAIPNLISDLVVNSEHGRISDSKSIETYFHSNGINMRYLGKVLSMINKKDHPHIHMIVERVILVKTLKHVFREIMRNTSDVFIVAAIARGLNCLFSSPEIRSKLEKGDIDAPAANGSTSNANGDSKKKKKDKKKGSKATANKSLNSLQAVDENVVHTLTSIDLEIPESLHIKPSAIWSRVLHIATKRYQHSFPENINDYGALNLKFNRLATLRDLLLCIGVHIESLDYEFSAVETTSISSTEKSTKAPAQTSAGKSQLPFSAENVKNITPIVKFIEIASDDSKANIEMGEKSLNEGKVNEALEFFHTAADILMNLFGPVNKEHAYCSIKISNVYFKIRDFDQAIRYQKQAISIFKKLYGIDHQSTAQAISTLAYYYYSIKKYALAQKNMFKTIFIYSLIGGESHPDCFHTFINLSLMFQENEQHQASLSCLFEALDRSITVYGKNHIKIAGCYQAIALAHYDITDIKKAMEYQLKCIAILKHNLDAEDPRLKEALLFQQKFERTLSEKKKGTPMQLAQDSTKSK